MPYTVILYKKNNPININILWKGITGAQVRLEKITAAGTSTPQWKSYVVHYCEAAHQKWTSTVWKINVE